MVRNMNRVVGLRELGQDCVVQECSPDDSIVQTESQHDLGGGLIHREGPPWCIRYVVEAPQLSI